MENDVDDNIKDLFQAISCNDNEGVIDYFRNKEFYPWTYKNEKGFNALQLCCFNNNGSLAIEIIKTMKNRNIEKSVLVDFINQPTDLGYTALHYASYRGDIGTLEDLIYHGANVNLTNNKKLNVLHLAAQGDQPNVLVFFKEFYDMDCNVQDITGTTPLHWAAYTASQFALQFLLSFETLNINIQDNEGYTALHLGVISNKKEIVKKLLQNNIDKSIKDKKNRTAKDLALEKNLPEIYEILKNDHDSKSNGFFMFNVQIKKNLRSRFNIYMFILFHILIEPANFLILLPCK